MGEIVTVTNKWAEEIYTAVGSVTDRIRDWHINQNYIGAFGEYFADLDKLRWMMISLPAAGSEF